MPHFNVDPSEFKVAQYLLHNKPYNKLPRSNKKDNIAVIKQSYPGLPLYKTTHSIIKVGASDAPIYLAFNSKKNGPDSRQYNLSHVSIGKGTYGKVKYAQDQNGKIYAVKIQHIDILRNNASQTFYVGYDIDLYHCFQFKNQDSGNGKAYTVMRWLGISLANYLSTNIPLIQKFLVATKMAFQVHKLHAGIASKTYKRYAHADIKPPNFCIDEYGRVALVDVDMVNEAVDTAHTYTGTACYLPGNHQDKTGEYVDCYALRRCLFFPKKSKTHAAQEVSYLPPSVFSNNEFRRSGLSARLHTKTNSSQHYSALDIAVLVALASIRDISSYNRIHTRDEKQLIIIMMFAGIFDKAVLEHILAEPDSLSQLLPVFGIIDRLPMTLLNSALKDQNLLEKLVAIAKLPRLIRRYDLDDFVDYYLSQHPTRKALLAFPLSLSADAVKAAFVKAMCSPSPAKIIDQEKLLSYAALYQLDAEFKQGITCGADLSARGVHGYPPLLIAYVIAPTGLIMRQLAQISPDLNVSNLYGLTLFDFCALNYQYPLLLRYSEYFLSPEQAKKLLFLTLVRPKGSTKEVEHFKYDTQLTQIMGDNIHKYYAIGLCWLQEVYRKCGFSLDAYFRMYQLLNRYIYQEKTQIKCIDVQVLLCACAVLSVFLEASKDQFQGLFNLDKSDLLLAYIQRFCNYSANAFSREKLLSYIEEIIIVLNYDLLVGETLLETYDRLFASRLSNEAHAQFISYLTLITFDARFVLDDQTALVINIYRSLFNKPTALLAMASLQSPVIKKIEDLNALFAIKQKITGSEQSRKLHVDMCQAAVDIQTVRKILTLTQKNRVSHELQAPNTSVRRSHEGSRMCKIL